MATVGSPLDSRAMIASQVDCGTPVAAAIWAAASEPTAPAVLPFEATDGAVWDVVEDGVVAAATVVVLSLAGATSA